jgi:hypothetical protein
MLTAINWGRLDNLRRDATNAIDLPQFGFLERLAI